jgi:hypothetical protein
MGVTCSLLGHDYGPEETDRQREERGEEVIVTVREVRVCSRCGTELVTSENTEVRPVRSASERDTEEDAPDTPPTAEDGPANPRSPGTTAGPEIDIDADVGPETSDDTEATGGDAVILGADEDDEDTRPSGEWPDADDTRLAEDHPDSTPSDSSDDEEAGEDEDTETEILGSEPGDTESEPDDTSADPSPGQESGTDPERAAGDWPDPGPGGGEDGFDAAPPDESADDDDLIEPEPGGAGAAVPSSHDEPSGDVVLVCPSCGFSLDAIGSSHRSGDICPECKRGYLSERAP